MYFIRGGLPWQGIKAKSKEDKYMKIKVKKISSTPDELCKGYPGKDKIDIRRIRKIFLLLQRFIF